MSNVNGSIEAEQINEQPKPKDPEDIEIEELIETVDKQYISTPKFEKWLELYLDKENKLGYRTYRRQTLAACIAYGYERKDRRQYLIAAQIGHRNVNKYQHIASDYFLSQDIDYATMMDLYYNMMIAKKDIDMWYTLMQTLDYPTPAFQHVTKGVVINQHNTQYNIADNADYSQLSDEELMRLVKTKERKLSRTVLGDITGTDLAESREESAS